MSTVTFFILITSGSLAGFLGGLLGIGGGIIYIPTLIMLLGFEPKTAVGTSLFVIFPTALVGSLVHFKYGNVKFLYGFVLLAVSLIFTMLGAKTANAIHGDVLKKIFAVVFMIIAVKMFFSK